VEFPLREKVLDICLDQCGIFLNRLSLSIGLKLLN
jgi:hypothetical protein